MSYYDTHPGFRLHHYDIQNVQHPERIPEGIYIGGMGELQGLWAVGDTEEEAWAEFVSVVRDAAGITTEDDA